MKNVPLVFLIIIKISIILKKAISLKTEEIVGGDIAAEGQFKYQVSVQVSNLPVCGGGIISSHHIVSAAHCIVDDTNGRVLNKSISVVTGLDVLNLEDSSNRHQVIKVFFSTDYQADIIDQPGYRKEGDICVLKVKHASLLNSTNYLELPDENFSMSHLTAIIAGYGVSYLKMISDEYGNVILTINSERILRYAQVDIMSIQDCTQLYEETVFNSIICARVKQRNPPDHEGCCLGDSGSPLVYNGKILLGVFTSGPAGCLEHTLPGIYTNVLGYLSFIDKVIHNRKSNTIRAARLVIQSETEVQYLER